MTSLQDLRGTYTIDPDHSQIGFVTRHAMVTKVRGAFNEFEGTAKASDGAQGATIELTIKSDSIDTRNGQRDGHVKGEDFLAVEEFPTITFTSTDTKVDGDTLTVTGDLTIKGTTKSITVPFEFDGAATDPFGNERIGFEGKTTINRQEYGVTFNAPLEGGGVLVSDKITLEFEISAIKQA